MEVERQNKAENLMVKTGRPSICAYGGIMPIHDVRVRQPLVAKEPLCGNQPANLSLVIAVYVFRLFPLFYSFRFLLTRRFL